MAFQDSDIRQLWRESVKRIDRVSSKDFAESSHANERKGNGLTYEQAEIKYGLRVSQAGYSIIRRRPNGK
jgi:hypothetical protein